MALTVAEYRRTFGKRKRWYLSDKVIELYLYRLFSYTHNKCDKFYMDTIQDIKNLSDIIDHPIYDVDLDNKLAVKLFLKLNKGNLWDT